MKDYTLETKISRILNPLYPGEEFTLLFMWIKQNSITIAQMKYLIHIITNSYNNISK